MSDECRAYADIDKNKWKAIRQDGKNLGQKLRANSREEKINPDDLADVLKAAGVTELTVDTGHARQRVVKPYENMDVGDFFGDDDYIASLAQSDTVVRLKDDFDVYVVSMGIMPDIRAAAGRGSSKADKELDADSLRSFFEDEEKGLKRRKSRQPLDRFLANVGREYPERDRVRKGLAEFVNAARNDPAKDEVVRQAIAELGIAPTPHYTIKRIVFGIQTFFPQVGKSDVNDWLLRGPGSIVKSEVRFWTRFDLTRPEADAMFYKVWDDFREASGTPTQRVGLRVYA